MGQIFRELVAEAHERDTRAAFESWMRKRGTPLVLEQTQAYEAFKAGMSHQACMEAVRQFQSESKGTLGVATPPPACVHGEFSKPLCDECRPAGRCLDKPTDGVTVPNNQTKDK